MKTIDVMSKPQLIDSAIGQERLAAAARCDAAWWQRHDDAGKVAEKTALAERCEAMAAELRRRADDAEHGRYSTLIQGGDTLEWKREEARSIPDGLPAPGRDERAPEEEG